MTEWTPEDLEAQKRRNPDFAAANPGLDNARKLILHEAEKKTNKYHVASKEDRTYNGRIYDSKKEMINAQENDLRVKAGDIDFWLYHVRFPIPGGVYEADAVTFKFWEMGKAWGIEVQEVKGYWTPDAKLKMKLFKETYSNVKITVV